MAAADALGDGMLVVVVAGVPEELQAASARATTAEAHSAAARRARAARGRPRACRLVACFVERLVRGVRGREGLSVRLVGTRRVYGRRPGFCVFFRLSGGSRGPYRRSGDRQYAAVR